jgi:hypothetical protein
VDKGGGGLGKGLEGFRESLRSGAELGDAGEEGVGGVEVEAVVNPGGDSGGGELAHENVPVVEVGVGGAMGVF